MTDTAQLLTTIAIAPYALSALLYGAMWFASSRWLRMGAPVFLGLGMAINIFQIAQRWSMAGQPPFKTLYESLVLLAACTAIVYFSVEFIYRARVLGLPSALACMGVMIFAWSRNDKDVVNLPAALQSGWFIPHVVVYFFGYAALTVAFGAALAYLIRPKPIQTKRPDLIRGGIVDLEQSLDGAVRFGFAMLTVGLLFGAFWAREAWGDYWVWDPKETWSLVTWLVFGLYLHLYYLSAWRGKRLAVLVLLGFAAVAFTYLGMNLLPTASQSAHVYQ